MKRSALVFDLDGTLVDSAPDLAAAVNIVLAERGLPALALAEVKRMVGDGTAALVERALAARGAPFDAPALARFLALYEGDAATLTRPYPGVPETLGLLCRRGCRLAVCTNKPEQASRLVLSGLGLDGFFAAVLGGDSAPVRKPHPGHVLAAVAALDARPEEAAMIGDNENDAAAARAAAIPVVLMRYGYARQPLEGLGAAALLDDFAALPAVLERL